MRQPPTAIVVGGGNGVGLAVAHRLAHDGYAVGIVDLDGLAAEKAAEQLAGTGCPAVGCQADATSPNDMSAALERIEEQLGPVSYAALSVFHTFRAPLAEWDQKRWQSVVDVGMTAGFILARTMIPHMAARGGGSLVFVSSIMARFGFPNEPAYVAAKAGLEGLVRQLAVEHGPQGVRVNCVAPALVLVDRNQERWSDPEVLARHRDRFPLKRVGRPEDVAAAAAFLLSDDAAFITGVTLPVDGGMAVRPPSMGDEGPRSAKGDDGP